MRKVTDDEVIFAVEDLVLKTTELELRTDHYGGKAVFQLSDIFWFSLDVEQSSVTGNWFFSRDYRGFWRDFIRFLPDRFVDAILPVFQPKLTVFHRDGVFVARLSDRRVAVEFTWLMTLAIEQIAIDAFDESSETVPMFEESEGYSQETAAGFVYRWGKLCRPGTTIVIEKAEELVVGKTPIDPAKHVEVVWRFIQGPLLIFFAFYALFRLFDAAGLSCFLLLFIGHIVYATISMGFYCSYLMEELRRWRVAVGFCVPAEAGLLELELGSKGHVVHIAECFATFLPDGVKVSGLEGAPRRLTR